MSRRIISTNPYIFNNCTQERNRKLDQKEKNSCIYAIRSNKTDKFYIGSTYRPISKVLDEHKRNYIKYSGIKDYCSSFEIIKFDDAFIEILEDCSGMNRRLLFKREGELIRENKDKVVNLYMLGNEN